MNRLYLTILFVASSLLYGCHRSIAARDAADRKYPAMRQALTRELAGDFDGAIERYQELLLQTPRLASAHLALALLLHDYRRDYIGAIYHYRRYLDMRENSEKLLMISNRVQVAEQLLAAQAVKKLSSGDAGGQIALLQQIDELSNRLHQAEAERARLNLERDQLTAQNKELQSQITRLQHWMENLQNPAPNRPGTTVRPPESTLTQGVASDTPTMRSYEVRPGDSLSRIAESVYGDPTLWPRIRDANRDKLNNGERVRVGDVLRIP